MKEIIGMRALSMLLAALLVSGTMVPAVSAENESRGWLDTFDQWVEPRDMSKYTPVIETPQRVPITEEIAQQHPGVIILDPKRVLEFQMIDADVVPTSPGKVSLTLQTESSDLAPGI